VIAKQLANRLRTLLNSLLTGNRGGWNDPIVCGECKKSVPSSVRLSTLSAAIFKAHFSEVPGIAGRATDEYLHALIAKETTLDVFPSLYGPVPS
jgi:hypothetical protein